MSNDPNKPAAKTIMGWMPVQGQPPAPVPGQPPAAPQPGYPPAAQPGYPPAAQPQPGYPPQAQPGYPPAPQAPAPQPAWGAPPAQPQPMQPAWGAPPAQPPQPQPMQPAWGAPPAGPPPAQPMPQPQAQPMMQPAWGAPPAGPPPGQPMPQPQAQPMMQPAWGAPPAGPPPAQPAPQPGWGAPPPAGAAPSPFGGMPNPMAGAPSPMSGMGAMSGGGTSRDSMGAQATQGVSDRVRFIRLTYLHLFGAILLFAGLEYLLMQPGTAVWDKVSVPILKFSLGDRYNWLVVLAVFGVVSWIADYWASHATSKPMQYVGLGLYVIAEALIFLPLLFLAELQAAEYLAKTGKEAHIIRDAAFLTLAIFGALTASVFVTKKDFSFLRGALAIASGAALVVIVVSILFGFNLGLLFSVAMVILCAGYVLYYTSQVFAHYHTEQYVAASLALFSSIALMFWYVIRILMKLRES